MARGIGVLERLAAEVCAQARQESPVSALVVGTERGGSDATSGLVSNPVIGMVSDLAVACGGAWYCRRLRSSLEPSTY